MSDWGAPASRLVGAASAVLERTIDRRGLIWKTSLVGAAVATSGLDFILRPGSAYASVCGPGSSCNSGWTAMCCTIHEGENRCPPGTFAGGWWKATGASLCGGKSRYYVDCHAKCTKCGCARGSHFCASKCQNCKSKCADGACDKRKTCHNRFRYGQCNRDMPCAGAISCRAISCTPPWKWADCSTTSATDNRTIAHSASCLPVWSSIMKRYTAMGSQGSVLGATYKKEFDGHRGRIQRYEHGRMYWSKKTGAHWLNSTLLARYLKLEQSKSPLGLPIDDAHETPGGRGVRFEHGGIYQGDDRDAYALWGSIWYRWDDLRKYRSPLGYPTSNRTVTQDKQGAYARFEGGVILDSPHTPTRAVWGLAAKRYAALSYERGPLGYPTVEERAVTDVDGVAGKETRFVSGTVVVVGASAVAVWGAIHQAWRGQGGATGSLGFPTSNVIQSDATHQTCTFRHGTLTYDSVTGVVTQGP